MPESFGISARRTSCPLCPRARSLRRTHGPGGEIRATGGVGGGAPARFSRTALPSPCALPRCFKKVAPLFGPACQEQEPSERGFFQGWPQPPACMASAGLTRLATVVTQERGQLVHRFFQNGDARQVDDTEVVGLFPVET